MNVYIVQYSDMPEIIIRASTRSQARYKAFKEYKLNKIMNFSDTFKKMWSIKKYRSISKEDFYPKSNKEKQYFYNLINKYNLDISLGDKVIVNIADAEKYGYIVGANSNLRIKIYIPDLDHIFTFNHDNIDYL